MFLLQRRIKDPLLLVTNAFRFSFCLVRLVTMLRSNMGPLHDIKKSLFSMSGTCIPSQDLSQNGFMFFPFLHSVSMSPERFVTNIQAERLLISAQMENGTESPLIGQYWAIASTSPNPIG